MANIWQISTGFTLWLQTQLAKLHGQSDLLSVQDRKDKGLVVDPKTFLVKHLSFGNIWKAYCTISYKDYRLWSLEEPLHVVLQFVYTFSS